MAATAAVAADAEGGWETVDLASVARSTIRWLFRSAFRFGHLWPLLLLFLFSFFCRLAGPLTPLRPPPSPAPHLSLSRGCIRSMPSVLVSSPGIPSFLSDSCSSSRLLISSRRPSSDADLRYLRLRSAITTLVSRPYLGVDSLHTCWILYLRWRKVKKKVRKAK
ncbi:hypothetical protein O6H91_Y516700 [Diphasiastrum complanatum]|nr:hypothetical protein O6H91_Y516700 [Diphasiastrum complanatum]